MIQIRFSSRCSSSPCDLISISQLQPRTFRKMPTYSARVRASVDFDSVQIDEPESATINLDNRDGRVRVRADAIACPAFWVEATVTPRDAQAALRLARELPLLAEGVELSHAGGRLSNTYRTRAHLMGDGKVWWTIPGTQVSAVVELPASVWTRLCR